MLPTAIYRPRRHSTSEFVRCRDLSLHLRRWGPESATTVWVMLHGWMDSSASFQFLVDYLPDDWLIVAPDWRGFGLSQRTPTDCYWFVDYLADLDALLQQRFDHRSVHLLGHSMGANVALSYAGVRPQRIRQLVNLEGFGLPATQAKQAPERLRRWLDELTQPQSVRSFATLLDLQRHLQKNAPGLSDAKALFIATHWAWQRSDGHWEILGDPAHKVVNPYLYRLDEMLCIWASIECPVLQVEAENTNLKPWLLAPEEHDSWQEFSRRFDVITQQQQVLIPAAGHMLHWEQPEALAQAIINFYQQ